MIFMIKRKVFCRIQLILLLVRGKMIIYKRKTFGGIKSGFNEKLSIINVYEFMHFVYKCRIFPILKIIQKKGK